MLITAICLVLKYNLLEAIIISAKFGLGFAALGIVFRLVLMVRVIWGRTKVSNEFVHLTINITNLLFYYIVTQTDPTNTILTIPPEELFAIIATSTKAPLIIAFFARFTRKLGEN